MLFDFGWKQGEVAKLHFLEINEHYLEQTNDRIIPLQYNV